MILASTTWWKKTWFPIKIMKDMGVSNNRGTPKWMVKIMENPIKMDDFEGKTPLFLETPTCCRCST